MHLSKGVDSPLLNSCPSITVYRDALCTNRFASRESSGVDPLVIYSTIGVLQSSTSTCKMAHGEGRTSSTTDFKVDDGLVLANLESKSARLFSSLGMCLISNLERPSRLSLTLARYLCNNGSLAWYSPFIWDTTNWESEHKVIVVAPSSFAARIPAKQASYSA